MVCSINAFLESPKVPSSCAEKSTRLQLQPVRSWFRSSKRSRECSLCMVAVADRVRGAVCKAVHAWFKVPCVVLC